jgi:hypothetical protein
MRLARATTVLAFLLGIASIAVFETILSYQSSNCSNQQQANRANTPSDADPTATHTPPVGEQDKKQKTTSAPFACEVSGLPSAVRQFMNHNEGFVVGGFTCLLVFVTAWLVNVTGGLRESTDKLWLAGERQLAATQRPWVKVDSIRPISDLVFENGEGRIDLLITVSNKGNSPGLRVRVNVKLVASNQINLLQEQQTFAAVFRRNPVQNELRPELTSWPGDTIAFPVRAWLSSVEMPRFKPLADNTPFPITLLTIVGCVDYEFSFDSGHHQTGIIFDLRKNTLYPRSRFGPIYSDVDGAILLEDGGISKDDLSLSIGFVGTGPVD